MRGAFDAANLAAWVPRLAGKRVVVLGDLCLDEYLVGRAERLSREAPVPVLNYRERYTIPGAAANPALNIAALGSQAMVVGVVGEDGAATALRMGLEEYGVEVGGLVVDRSRGTTVKTRVMAEISLRFPQQVVRVDRQDRRPLSRGVRQQVLAALRSYLGEADALLLSDYRSGVLDPLMVREAVRLANQHNVVIATDCQGELRKYRDCTLVRCNREEAETAVRRSLRSDAALERALSDLQRRLRARNVVITRSSEGMSLINGAGRTWHLPATNRQEVYDTTGAGDTVVALLTLGLTAGASLLEAAHLANVAAGIVVQRLGNAAPSPEEMLEALLAGKELPQEPDPPS